MIEIQNQMKNRDWSQKKSRCCCAALLGIIKAFQIFNRGRYESLIEKNRASSLGSDSEKHF